MTRPVNSGAARWRAERRPSETDALLVEAHRHLGRDHRDRARRMVKETLLTEMSLPEGLEVGRLLHLLDETQAAVDLFHTLLRQARDSVDRAAVRAALLMVLGRYDEAVEPLRFLVDQRPDDAEAHLRLGQCFARSGRDEDAVAALRRARQVAPDWPDMLIELGRLALRLGAVEDARVALYRAWRIDPDDRRNTLAIAGLWMRARRSDEAMPLYEHALAQHPGAHEVLGACGLAFARGGRLDAARDCLERLEATHPRRTDDARRLTAAIDEAAAAGASIELDEDDIVSIDGSLPPAEPGAVPDGFAELVPVPAKARRLDQMTTGDVEAALGTLDLDISMDDFGSFDDEGSIPPPLHAEPPSAPPIPPPLADEPDGSSGADGSDGAHGASSGAEAADDGPPPSAPPEPVTPPQAPRVEPPPSSAALLAPPPAAVPAPPPPAAGDSVERAFDALVSDAPDAAAAPLVVPTRPPEAAPPSSPPTPARPARPDEPPRLHADIPSARPGESHETPAPRAPSAFALLGPPPGKRRPTGPLPTDAALPPLMAFGSLSGDLSTAGIDEPDPPFETRRTPPKRRSRRSTGSMPLLAPRPSSAPPDRSPPERGPSERTPPPARSRPGDSVGGSMGSVGSVSGPGASSMGAGSTDRSASGSVSGVRRSRPPTGGHRRFDAPPGAGPTGPLPSLPRRQPFAEMTVGQGLAHRGGSAEEIPRGGRSRRGDRPRTAPGGPMPPPDIGWGAAPRTDPLLTTSDALQRWRPPARSEVELPTPPPGPVRRPPSSEPGREAPPGDRLGRASPSLRSQTALIAGSQRVFWIPRVLRFMEAGHLSGAVGLSAPRGQGEVQFRAGRLTGASASNRPTLAQMLQAPERLRPEQRGQLGDLTWTAQDGESLLDRLVETGLFEAPNVNATVIDQVFATISEMLGWHAGWFTLVAHPDPPTRGGRMVKLPLAALLSGVEDDRPPPGSMGAGHLRPAAAESSLDGRLEARIRAQRQRVERAPDDDRARLQLGQLLMRAEHYVQAIDVFMTGLSGSVDQRYVKLIGLAIEGLARHGPRRGSEQHLRIALCGRLGRVGLVQLLDMLNQERVTGTVRLMAHEGLAEVDLSGGELAGATNSNTARLGDLMRASSIMTSDQIEALVARQFARERWMPLGRLALEAGLLEPDQMRGLLQKQVRLALLESGRWRQAHFLVELGERDPGLRLGADLDTPGILRDLRRMVGRAR